MSRGRKALSDPPVKFSVCIPQSLSNKLDLLLLDPTHKRCTYGAKSALISSLLQGWIAGIQTDELNHVSNHESIGEPDGPPATSSRP